MAFKVYAHFDPDGAPPFSLPVLITRPEETQFGTVKQAFIKQYEAQFPGQASIEYDNYCFWNQDCCPIADRTSVATHSWEHNDFFLRPLPTGASPSGALASSQQKRGELSYYYAHGRNQQPLVSKPQQVSAPASAPLNKEPIKNVVHTGAPTTFNAKQSPFGTNINQYETITSYTWEDHNDDTVKVLVPLDGVGKLKPSEVRSQFGERSFELLIENYNGKSLRFACYKTHGFMKPDECKHIVRANRINLVLRKAKEKDIWFDLFKKRAIGDDDDP